ncbi:sodium-coupled neutral amino acid transporter 4 isoform X3 [Gallus gallus]|uniref:sodium-coupled neutral amino acid transporter 4 isoform X3 n=1 Tax=Gallus gallus TaxID=9031 RepID=UPI000D63EE89|nr:sodium-coupled neutral amino acid transporter 4 isoform X3 [Gallus gallus]XP_046793910.1 sodium-coupled neutral amino acid transporter 4 isoform X3 [Gallus gallus]|eukprot:XP_025003551.1 sodium-coupled neutral amino acid transporter 4 isoform X4 [Gallus gallus]
MLESADHSVDLMEQQKVNIELEEQSNSGESLEDNYTELIDSEKAAIRSPFASDDAESQKFLTNGYLDKKKLEDYNEEYHRGRASFGMSSFNLSNAIMGSGILGLSYAMANTGIILFVVLLLSVAVLSLYSVHLLLKTSKEGGSLIYEKLGEKAFGWPGKCSVFISVTMQNIGAMSSYLFIIKYELPEVIRAFMKLEENSGEWYLNGNYLVILVTVVIILPLSLLKTLGYLGYTSGFSLTCMVFFVSVVIFKKFQIPCPLPIMDHGVGNWTATNITLPMHLVMLPNESLSSGVNFMMDNTVGHVPGLEEPRDTFLKSGVEYEAHSDSSDTCQPKYFVFNSRIRSSISALLFPKRPFSWIRHLLIAAVILAFNSMLVIFVPTIKDIFGFIGASSATMLIFILPSAFYLRLVKKEPMRSPQKIGALIFLIVGIIFMIVSMTLIVMDWIYNPPRSRHH